MELYLDTNAICDLSERRKNVTDEDVAALEHAITTGKLEVSISTVVIDEILETAGNDPTKTRRLLGFIHHIGDPNRILKPPARMLREDLESHLSEQALKPRHLKRSAKCARTIRTFLETLPVDRETGALVTRFRQDQKDAFFRTMDGTRGETTEELEAIVGPKAGRSDTEFAPFFRAHGPELVKELAERFGLLTESNASKLERIFEVPSLRAYAGIAASWVYAHQLEGRRLQRSAGDDQKHAVLASAADRFITSDAELRRLLQRIPEFGFKTQSLAKFLHSLQP